MRDIIKKKKKMTEIVLHCSSNMIRCIQRIRI